MPRRSGLPRPPGATRPGVVWCGVVWRIPPSTRPREGEDDGTLRRGQSTWTCQRPRRASGSVTASARSDSPAVWCIGGRWLRNRTPRPRAAADPLGHVARAALLASWPMRGAASCCLRLCPLVGATRAVRGLPPSHIWSPKPANPFCRPAVRRRVGRVVALSVPAGGGRGKR